MPTKDELEKELAKAEKKIASLEAELAAAGSAAPAGDPDRVFGPDAVPLEQR